MNRASFGIFPCVGAQSEVDLFVSMVGLSESTVSLAWFPTQPRTLVAGQGQKFLRMYDLRGEYFDKSSHSFWS